MEEQKIKRESNFELMRIFSMLMIIIWHIIIFKYLLPSTTGSINFAVDALKSICNVHVLSFMLLMGYFQCQKKLKFNKVLSLIGTSWFYRIVFTACFLLLGHTLASTEILRAVFILPNNTECWFLCCYLITYCLSPFINLLIEKMSKKNYQSLLLLLFILFSIIPTITGQQFFSTSQGYSVYIFIFAYMIGGYLRLYPIKDSYHFKKMSNKKYLFMLVLALGFFYLFHFSFHFLAIQMTGLGSGIIQRIGNIFSMAFWAYDNPIVIIEAIIYFLIFSSISVGYKKNINVIASTTIGVYLIHDNPFVKSILYDKLLNFPANILNSWFIFVYIMGYAVLIFAVCFFIEWCRQKTVSLINKRRKKPSLGERLSSLVNSNINS